MKSTRRAGRSGSDLGCVATMVPPAPSPPPILLTGLSYPPLSQALAGSWLLCSALGSASLSSQCLTPGSATAGLLRHSTWAVFLPPKLDTLFLF